TRGALRLRLSVRADLCAARQALRRARADDGCDRRARRPNLPRRRAGRDVHCGLHGLGAMRRLLTLLLAPTPTRYAPGATVLRVAAGAILIGFGASKYAHHAREARAFDRYGLPWPSEFAYVTGTVELVFGVLLVLGLATRPAALVLAGNMVGAIATGG